MCCSGGRAAQPSLPPGETLPLPDLLFPLQPCLPSYGQECRRNFLCLMGAGPVGAMSGREMAEKPLVPWGGWQVSALPALCLHGWNFPGSSPSATTTTLQIPRNATHENAFLAHSWHGQHLFSKESAVRDFKLRHCGKKMTWGNYRYLTILFNFFCHIFPT